MSGTQGVPATAEVYGNVFIVPVTVGTTASRAMFDTGAPVTIFDPGSLTAETLPNGQGSVAKLLTGGLTFTDAPAIGAPLNLALPDGRLAGLVGGDLLCHFATSFNYRDSTITLGDGAAPGNLGVAGSVAFTVEGGGLGTISLGTSTATVTTLPTRISITALVEGTAHSFLIDSGASYSVVTPAVFDGLVSDGRKVIDMIGAQTVMGAIGTRVTRSRSLSLGGIEVQGALISAIDSTLLAQLSQEVGHPVEGLIGGTFLREFYVTADYGRAQLKLSRYTTRAHIHDEFIRIGLVLRELPNHPAGSPRYEIGRVFAGSDAAAKGLTAGTQVLQVDGIDLGPLNSIAAEKLMVGTAGTTKTIQTSSTAVTLKVEDLLAL